MILSAQYSPLPFPRYSSIGKGVSVFNQNVLLLEQKTEGRRQKIDGSWFQYESESQESPWRLLYFRSSVSMPVSPNFWLKGYDFLFYLHS